MVIGNGFFSENRQTALAEMTERSKCEVRHLPFPTVGNITYYISYTGDLYGQQMIQGRPLTRQRKHQKYSIGYTARLSAAPHKEANYHLQVLTWSAFVLNRWQPDVDLEFKNGNCYDVKYIQRRFHIQGGEVPDETFVLTMQHYVRQLEQHLEECKRNNVTDTQIPEWAHKLMRDRYGMKLHG